MIPENPGCLVFLPGAADTLLVASDMKNWKKDHDEDGLIEVMMLVLYFLFQFQFHNSRLLVYSVNGDERSDIKTLVEDLEELSIRDV